MVVILVFLTFCFAILVGGFVRYLATRQEVSPAKFRRAALGEAPVFRIVKEDLALSPAGAPSSRIYPLQFPASVYYHKGHAWAKPEGDRRVRVGLDDFTQQVMGNIDDIELPPIGKKLSQGEVAWKVRHGKRQLSQLAPLGGTVVEVNEKLLQDPCLANRSPYEKGWVLKIQPTDFNEEMPRLMDSFQFRVSFDDLKAKLRSAISHQTLGMVYGDGEEVAYGIADKLDERLWRILVSQLFHSTQN
jgi:glycine cleavage system H protein